MRKEKCFAVLIAFLFFAPILINPDAVITHETKNSEPPSEKRIIITASSTEYFSSVTNSKDELQDDPVSALQVRSGNNLIGIDADNQKPKFVQKPAQNYNLNYTQRLNLTYEVEEENPFEYTIYRDGEIAEGPTSYQSLVPFNHTIDPLAQGLTFATYNYTIFIEDTLGQSNIHTSYVAIYDGVDPVIVQSPTDKTILDTSTGNTLSWTAIDDYNDTYELLLNSATFATGTWSNNTPVTFNIDGLDPGVNDFTIYFYDNSSNFKTDTVSVTVTDTILPQLDSRTGNITIEFGSTGNNIFWNITDAQPNNYTIMRDGVIQQTGMWDNPTSISINVDNLAVGLYNYTVLAADQATNTYKNTQWVNVTDSTQPAITLSSGDKTYVEGVNASSILLTWTATDLLPDTYEMYRNGTLVAFNSWSSGEEINYLDDRGWGIWEYEIKFYDQENNIGSDTIFITVLDTTGPRITWKSDDLTYAVGTTGHEIQWAADDLHPHTYQIYFEMVAQTDSGSSGTWFTNQSIPVGGYSVDGLDIGEYNYTIVFSDKSGNWVQSTITVIVSDKPTITDSPGDFSYVEGDTGHDLIWIVSDSDPDYYKIFDNDSIVVKEGNWVPGSNITWNVDGLAIGNYYYMLWVNDSGNNIVTDTSWVQVVDIPVLISNPSDIPGQLTYSEGDTGNKLSWNFTDASPGNYELYRNNSGPLAIENGIIVDTGSWTNADHINITGPAIDGLSKGVYNFTIIVYDENDNTGISRSITDWVLLTVVDTTDPTLNSRTPSGGTLTYSEEDSGNVLIWNADDNYPDTYKIYREMDQISPIQEGTWASGVDITINVDGELKGIYNYTIVFYDKSSNPLVDTIWVEVIDTTLPQFNDYSADFSYNISDTGNEIFFIATEAYPTVYNITRNITEIVRMDTAYNGDGSTPHSLNIDGLGLGLYNYTIGIFDESGNANYVTIWVLVKEPDPPQLVEAPAENESYSEGNTPSFLLTWNATDVHPDTYYLFHNETGLPQQIGPLTWTNASEVARDVGDLGMGVYNYTIVFIDDYGNQKVYTTFLTVFDDTIPTIDSSRASVSSMFEGSTGNDLVWQANDLHPGMYAIYENSQTPIKQDTWQSMTDVVYNLDHLSLGQWNVTIQFFDESGNYAMHTLIIDVLDNTPPELELKPPDYTYSEGDPGNFLVFRALDNHPDYYDLFRNVTYQYSNSWQDDTNIQIPIDGLTVGVYNYTIVLFDTSGNSVRSVVFVTVEDSENPVITSGPTFDPVITELSTGNEIKFTATDDYPDYFEMSINGSQYANESWISGLETSVLVDNLAKGMYDLTLIVYDKWGNFVTTSFSLEVVDLTKPEILSSPEDFTYSEDSGGFSVNWMIHDNYPRDFEIFLDEELIESGDWNTSSPVSITVENLLWRSENVYNYTIVLYDDSNNLRIDTVLVTVIDELTPDILNSPSDRIGIDSILSNSSNNLLSWSVFDNHPSTFTLERNNKTISSAVWNNKNAITFNLDGTPNGNYTYTIFIYDVTGNLMTDTVHINIKDPETVLTKKPQIPIHREVHNGDAEIFNTTWYDINERPIKNAQVTVKLNRGGEILREIPILNKNAEQFEITLNYSSPELIPGSYQWIFIFTKDFHDQQEVIIPIEILPHSIKIDIQHKKQLIRGQNYLISAQVEYTNDISNNVSLHLSQFISLSGPVIGLEIEFTITVILMNDDPLTYQKRETTNQYGVAQTQLDGTETQNIKSIVTINAGFSNILYEDFQESAKDLSTVTVTDQPNPISLIIDFLMKYLIALLILVGIIVLSLYFFMRRRSRRLKFVNALMKDLVLAEAELNAIKSIHGVIVQHVSGLPLYEYQVGRLPIDSILISGLSSAISSFLNELDKEETFGFDIIERQSISITSHKMQHSNFIIVSNTRLPLILLDQIKRVHQNVENKFMASFEFQPSGYDELPQEQIEAIFSENEFKIHLTGKISIDPRKHQSLYRLRALSRILRQKLVHIEEFNEQLEGNSFYLEELVDYLEDKGLAYTTIARLVILSFKYNSFQNYELDYSNNFTQ